MSLFRIYVPGIGIMVVRASDAGAAQQAAKTAAGNLGIQNPQPELQGNINSPSEVTQYAGGWLINQQGGVISQINNTTGQQFQSVLNAFVNGQYDQGQNRIEETTNPQPSGGATPGPNGTAGGAATQGPTPGGTTVVQPETPPSSGFNPAEGASVTFGPNVLTQALRSLGIDTSRPGQSFLGSLFPEVQASEAIRSVLGLPNAGSANTADPFANYAINTLGSGARGLGASSLEALRALAGMGGNGTYSDFNSPASLGTNAANTVQNLASGALLSRLSPTAYSLFGNQLVGNVANQYGNQVAGGNAPLNFAQYFLQNLGL